MAQSSPSSTEEAGSQQGATAGGEDEVRKGSFPGHAGRMDKRGECGTMQDRLARSMDNGTQQDQFPHQVLRYFKTKTHLGQLEAARDWKIVADVGQWLIFPPEIVLWFGSPCLVHLVELTVPWEDVVDKAYERKKLRYAQLAAEAEQQGWGFQVYPVEVGCQGFVAHSTTRFVRDIRFSGQELRHIVKNSEAAERSGNWLWLRRKESNVDGKEELKKKKNGQKKQAAAAATAATKAAATPAGGASLFPWCSWCGKEDHRWRSCPEVPPADWYGRCEEYGHSWEECFYAQAQEEEQLPPQVPVSPPLPTLPPGSPPSQEIWDWLVHPEADLFNDLPLAINALWCRDGGRWDEWERQHHPASIQEITLMVLGYLAEDMGQAPVVREPEGVELLSREPEGVEEPWTREPEGEEPRTQEPEGEEPRTREPEGEEPRTREPEGEEPWTGEPEVEEPRTGEPEVEEPRTKEPEREKADAPQQPLHMLLRGAQWRCTRLRWQEVPAQPQRLLEWPQPPLPMPEWLEPLPLEKLELPLPEWPPSPPAVPESLSAVPEGPPSPPAVPEGPPSPPAVPEGPPFPPRPPEGDGPPFPPLPPEGDGSPFPPLPPEGDGSPFPPPPPEGDEQPFTPSPPEVPPALLLLEGPGSLPAFACFEGLEPPPAEIAHPRDIKGLLGEGLDSKGRGGWQSRALPL
ncbi:UNVERIFIED_CONTAM: hypothetical protein FKN15_007901 [Acipenser sinensis]